MQYDDVCKFDENGICLRHKTKHEGRLYRLSQDRTNIGYQHRKAWDKTIPSENIDDVCKFDESGVCLRHGFRHEGKAMDMSQERSARGHRIRKQWDEVKARSSPSEKGCGCKKKGNLH